MAEGSGSRIRDIVDRYQGELLEGWLACQARGGATRSGRVTSAEIAESSQRFLRELRHGLDAAGERDLGDRSWSGTRELLEEVSRTRAAQGFTPSETASFIFSLKEPLFALLRRELGDDAARLGDEIWIATKLLDGLGLYTMEVFQKGREEVIARQQEELLELSTPVVELADGILALPLIGTLDSARTQIVMENLLQQIVAEEAEIAIIDITGVPTVDTLVAQHLIKTVSAARLMGADCIISGIRPQIAQTIVHLGLELDVVSKATMADAFGLALRRVGRAIVSTAAARPAAGPDA